MLFRMAFGCGATCARPGGGARLLTSKAALVGFTRSLAREAGPKNIRANLVMLGAVRTEAEAELDRDGSATRERLAGCQSLPGRLAPMTSPARSPSSPAT